MIAAVLELSLEDHGISPNASTAGAKYLTAARMYTVHHPLPGNQNTTGNDNGTKYMKNTNIECSPENSYVYKF